MSQLFYYLFVIGYVYWPPGKCRKTFLSRYRNILGTWLKNIFYYYYYDLRILELISMDITLIIISILILQVKSLANYKPITTVRCWMIDLSKCQRFFFLRYMGRLVSVEFLINRIQHSIGHDFQDKQKKNSIKCIRI